MTEHRPATATSAQEKDLRRSLLAGIKSIGLNPSDEQVSQLLSYLQLFAKWNTAYNLSAVRNTREMVSRHLLDSLSIVPYLKPEDPDDEEWLDVGSGGGLPGIPLAILFPDRKITLLDSNGKKTRFLFQAKTELQLHSVDVVQSRVEDYRPERGFDRIFSRAFASLKDFLTGCQHLVIPGGCFYAMKGHYPESELREVGKPFNVQHCYSLQVPGESAARHLVLVQREYEQSPTA